MMWRMKKNKWGSVDHRIAKTVKYFYIQTING